MPKKKTRRRATANRGGRREEDDYDVLYWIAEHKRRDPSREVVPLIREWAAKNRHLSDAQLRALIERVRKKYRERARVNQLPTVDPFLERRAQALRQKAEQKLAEDAEARRQLKIAHRQLRAAGINPRRDLMSLRQQLKREHDSFAWVVVGGEETTFEILLRESGGDAAKAEEVLRDTHARYLDVDRKLSLVNHVLHLRRILQTGH